MNISKKIMDETLDELVKEFKIYRESEGIRSFDEIEGNALNMEKELQR